MGERRCVGCHLMGYEGESANGGLLKDAAETFLRSVETKL
jgi:hypothetical protein